ncbi:MAG TPA: pyridoxamine 5'-phosphate oxidase family protein [Chloroflexota bacterium]|nr:pyridoxamine 5'-phosphate oxidase family protein [Chloroflexota bacterium]
MQNYSGAVPAVQRTVAVLEHLRLATSSLTLTELSQALALNRSSLLAILNTLRAACFVARDEAGRYHLGSGLLPYGAALARAGGLLEAFEHPAEWLVEASGESVALARLTAAGAVCVAFKPGRHSVRAIAELGQVTPVSRSAGALAVLATTEQACTETEIAPSVLQAVRTCGCVYVEEAAEPGQAALAAPVCDGRGQVVAAVELLAPSYRLTPDGGGLRTAGRLVIAAARQASLALGCAGYAPYQQPRSGPEPWRGSGAAGLQGSGLDGFLAQPWLASLACLRENGYPYTVPVWYEWRAGAFWLAPRLGARWAGYVRSQPRVSMTISEPAPPFRRVLVEGRAEQAKGPASAMVRRMAERYLGSYAGSYLATTAGRHAPAIRIAPDKLTSWEGLVARVALPSAAGTRRAG